MHVNTPTVSISCRLSNIVIVCFLTVSVEKGEDFPLSHAGTQQSGGDEALPLRLPHDANDLQLTHKVLQFALQVF